VYPGWRLQQDDRCQVSAFCCTRPANDMGEVAPTLGHGVATGQPLTGDLQQHRYDLTLEIERTYRRSAQRDGHAQARHNHLGDGAIYRSSDSRPVDRLCGVSQRLVDMLRIIISPGVARVQPG
jgi:hypothetical protein